jgi:hypothetical protein
MASVGMPENLRNVCALVLSCEKRAPRTIFRPESDQMIRFREKGGKETEIQVHHKLDELLDQYLEKSGLRNRPIRKMLKIWCRSPI